MPPRSHGARAPVLLCSAVQNKGIRELLAQIKEQAAWLSATGYTRQRRREQDHWWLRSTIEEALLLGFFNDPRVQAALPVVEAQMDQGDRSPFDAAAELLRLYKS
jgi:LAO/AO transport system kinase